MKEDRTLYINLCV